MQTAPTITDMPVPKKRKTSLAAIAYETIARNIITLIYEPGEHLEEKHLVDQLGIGRTPIREALQRLAAEKMVESLPNKGIIVSPITLQSTKAMFEAMRIIEYGVAELAVRKDLSQLLPLMEDVNETIRNAIDTGDILGLVEANHEFHLLFAHCSQNDYLVHAVSEVRNHAKRLSFLSYTTSIEPDRPLTSHYESVVHEHEEMMARLLAKDETRLKETIFRHIQTFQQRIIRFMTS